MASFSTLEALGPVIRDLRRERALTQEELGRRAGYGAGAGVAISRLESGQLHPSSERLEGIAAAFELTPNELFARAVERSKGLKTAAGDGKVSIEDRLARIRRANERRKHLVQSMEALTDARDRATDDFLMRFRDVAFRIYGVPKPDPGELEIDEVPEGDAPGAEAAYQIEFTRFGVAQALAGTAGGAAAGGAAYESFTEAVALGSAALGVVLPRLSVATALRAFGVATSVGQRSALGAGAARGSAVRGWIVAGAMATAVVASLMSRAKRNKRQQQELGATLDEIEDRIAETQPGVDALRELIPSATETLDYIATHAGHALNRWEGQIGQGAVDWRSLSAGGQERYHEFVKIAAAQLAVASIDFESLLKCSGVELEQARAVAGEVLAQSREVVTSRV